jgi:hypothetical protein
VDQWSPGHLALVRPGAQTAMKAALVRGSRARLPFETPCGGRPRRTCARAPVPLTQAGPPDRQVQAASGPTISHGCGSPEGRQGRPFCPQALRQPNPSSVYRPLPQPREPDPVPCDRAPWRCSRRGAERSTVVGGG